MRYNGVCKRLVNFFPARLTFPVLNILAFGCISVPHDRMQVRVGSQNTHMSDWGRHSLPCSGFSAAHKRYSFPYTA